MLSVFACEDPLSAASVDPEQPHDAVSLPPELARLLASPVGATRRRAHHAGPPLADPTSSLPARVTNTPSLRAQLIARAYLRRRPAFFCLHAVLSTRNGRPTRRILKRAPPRRGRDHPPCL